MNLTVRILIGMVLGLIVGALIQWVDLPASHWFNRFFTHGLIDAGGDIFVTLLRAMVVPLVLVSLTCGAASLGATGKVGRLGSKTIGLYLLTAIAVSLALSIALIVEPGASAADEGIPAPEFRPNERRRSKTPLWIFFPATRLPQWLRVKCCK